jgi:hypothetical protein
LDGRVTDQGAPSPKIDTSVPHSARIWNYWLGGKDDYPVDREAGDRYRAAYPQIVDVARAGRHFLARAVRFLAVETGVRQFIDVGTGLPAAVRHKPGAYGAGLRLLAGQMLPLNTQQSGGLGVV